MIRYLGGRVLGLIGALLVISFITFCMMKAVPGGPYDELHMPLSGAAKENILRLYGLDKPFFEQYLRLLRNFVTFDLGYSYTNRTETMNEFFARAWPISAQLGLLTMIVSYPFGILLGLISAYRPNTWVDTLASTLAMTGFMIPGFALGYILLIIFNVQLGWLPLSGWDTPAHWVMPVFVNALAPMGVAARYTRAAVIETLNSDYVRTAHAKGMRPLQVFLRHNMRNALIPIIAVLAPLVPILITGSVFIEQIFLIPGIGRYFALSIFNRDYPMIMALVLLLATLLGIFNLLADVLYTLADPRIRLTR